MRYRGQYVGRIVIGREPDGYLGAREHGHEANSRARRGQTIFLSVADVDRHGREGVTRGHAELAPHGLEATWARLRDGRALSRKNAVEERRVDARLVEPRREPRRIALGDDVELVTPRA